MRRLKQELKQTMEMYSTACKEALLAKQKVSTFAIQNFQTPCAIRSPFVARNTQEVKDIRILSAKLEMAKVNLKYLL